MTDDLSHNLDNKRNLGDYIHLSLIGDNPMLSAMLNRIKDDFVIILISPLILFYRAFLISDINATDSNAYINYYTSVRKFFNIRRLYNIKDYPDYDKNPNGDYKLAQAEIMIYDNIPLKFISEIIPLIR